MSARPLPPAFETMVAPARQRPGLWRFGPALLLLATLYLGLNALAWVAWAMMAGWDAADLLLSKMAIATTPASALLLLATFGPLALGTLAAVRGLHRRPIGSVFGPWRRFSGDFGTAVAVGGGVYLAAIGLWHLAYDSVPNLPFGIWVRFLPLALVAIGVQTLAEEMLFRGYLQVQLAARFGRAVIWGGLPALLFGALHYDPGGMGAAAPYAVFAATAFGLVAADLTARTGSIGAAWGLHLVNNMMALTLVATSGTITGLALRVTPYQVDKLALSPWLAVADLIPLLISYGLIRRLVQR